VRQLPAVSGAGDGLTAHGGDLLVACSVVDSKPDTAKYAILRSSKSGNILHL
jgi:hypothetical protein